MTGAKRAVFIHELDFQALIGVYDFEKKSPSRLRLTLELKVELYPHNDDIKEVVSYETVLNGIETLAMDHHRNLLETLADDIAKFCFLDDRVLAVDMRLDKPDIFSQTQSVGVRLKTTRP